MNGILKTTVTCKNEQTNESYFEEEKVVDYNKTSKIRGMLDTAYYYYGKYKACECYDDYVFDIKSERIKDN